MPNADESRSGTVQAMRQRAVSLLTEAGVPDPEVDADLIVGHVLGAGRGAVQAMAFTGAGIEVRQAQAVEALVARRAAREPLQHLTGRAPFRTLDLAVGPGVFVPRPETEVVAQLAIDALRVAVPADPARGPIAVDLGAGSGAIALALAVEVPHAEVYAVEDSPEALPWIRRNIAEAAPGVRLVPGDLSGALSELDGLVSVVVSNPPYIPAAAVPRDPEVRLHDPERALYGGEDGLDVVRAVSRTAYRLLHPGGTVVIEHGEHQGAALRELLGADGWRALSTQQDWTGRDRVTAATR